MLTKTLSLLGFQSWVSTSSYLMDSVPGLGHGITAQRQNIIGNKVGKN